MLKAARRRTTGMENVELLRGDVAALQSKATRLDAAMMVLVLT